MRKKTSLSQKVLWIVAVVIVCVFFAFPIIWMLLTALRPTSEVFYVHRGTSFTLNNFIRAWGNIELRRSFINSAIVATLSIAGSLMVAVPSGYLLGRFSGRYPKVWFGVLYVVRAIPWITWGLPLYLLINKMGLYDTYLGLLFPHFAVHITFFSLIMRGFFKNVSEDAEDAARIDGCSDWMIFLRIALPQVMTGIVAIAIVGWLWAWNEFLFALLLTSSKTPMLTATLVKYVHELGINWDVMSAAAILGIIPAIIVTIFAQKYIMRGLRV